MNSNKKFKNVCSYVRTIYYVYVHVYIILNIYTCTCTVHIMYIICIKCQLPNCLVNGYFSNQNMWFICWCMWKMPIAKLFGKCIFFQSQHAAHIIMLMRITKNNIQKQIWYYIGKKYPAQPRFRPDSYTTTLIVYNMHNIDSVDIIWVEPIFVIIYLKNWVKVR